MKTRFLSATLAFALTATPAASQVPDLSMTERIKEEGLQRSQALDLFHTLTDVYGGRLTGSPAYTAAANWARERFAEWGLTDARLEAFEFGRGWTLDKLSMEMTAPRYLPLVGHADAWTPSMAEAVEGAVVYVGDRSVEQIEAMSDQLRGSIVLTHQPQTEFRDQDRPQPGVGVEGVRTGNPPRIAVNSVAPTGDMRQLLQDIGAAALVRPTYYRDGTVGTTGSRNTPAGAVPSMVLSAEQYNMIVRLVQRGGRGPTAAGPTHQLRR